MTHKIAGLPVRDDNIGSCVLYVPMHAVHEDGFDIDECEVGHITSMNEHFVFVEYKPNTGGVATDPQDLRWWSE